MIELIPLAILLVAFQIKHLIADYYLQFPYMYENKGKDKGWFVPLFDHAFIHGLFTFTIISVYMALFTISIAPDIVVVTFFAFLFDTVTHFCIDRWKATRTGTPDTKSFWINLGIDQALHHVVGIIIILAVL